MSVPHVAQPFSENGEPLEAGTPYHMLPAGAGVHGQALTSVFSFTLPAGTHFATIQASVATVKYTTDGVTTPSSTVGMLLPVGGAPLILAGRALKNFQAIQVSSGALLDAEFFTH